MSEFYETNMELCDIDTINFEFLKSKYFETKKNPLHLPNDSTNSKYLPFISSIVTIVCGYFSVVSKGIFTFW